MSPDLDALIAPLRERWPLADRTDLREELLQAWSTSDRGYHDLLHLTEVLDRLDELAAEVEFDRTTVALAAWFHDAVYDTSPDPEGRSAAWAAEALAGTGADVDEVVRLVLLTRDHAPGPDDVNGTVLCDADLAILAAPPDRYAAYAVGVRREYATVPDDLFALGRAEVLRTFLARPALFSTAYARTRWEPVARDNASHELARLSAPSASDGAVPPDAAG